MGILHFRHFHPFRFGNTGDLYFICLLKYDGRYDGGKEFERDEKEIAAIRWMGIDEVLTQKGLQSSSGTRGCRQSIRSKVDLLVEHWDDDNVDLGLMSPTKMKPDRDYFVYGPGLNEMVASDQCGV